jgi:hypothetical protein
MPLTREEFWEVIDAARSAAMFDRAALPEALRDELSERGEDEVLDFIRHFHDCRVEAFRRELWAAAWIAGGGAAEADFSDFRDWLITLGREAFENALRDPQRLLDHADPAELRDPFDPDVAPAVYDAYEQQTGTPALSAPTAGLRPHPAVPTGRPWKPEELSRRFPKLWRYYNPE